MHSPFMSWTASRRSSPNSNQLPPVAAAAAATLTDEDIARPTHATPSPPQPVRVSRMRARSKSSNLLLFTRRTSLEENKEEEEQVDASSNETKLLDLVLDNKDTCDFIVQALLRAGVSDAAFQLRFVGFVNEFSRTTDKKLKQTKGKKIYDMFLHHGSQFRLQGIDDLPIKPKSAKDLMPMKQALLEHIGGMSEIMAVVKQALVDQSEMQQYSPYTKPRGEFWEEEEEEEG